MIYFIQGEITKRVKIGFTKRHIGSRISSLQTGSPDKLIFLGACAGNKSREKQLHKKFSPSHIHGEWFKKSVYLKEFVLNNCIHSLREAELVNIAINEGILTEKKAISMNASDLVKIGENNMIRIMESIS